MTNLEAAKILEREKRIFQDEYIDYGKVTEAYDMAISSLSNRHWVMADERIPEVGESYYKNEGFLAAEDRRDLHESELVYVYAKDIYGNYSYGMGRYVEDWYNHGADGWHGSLGDCYDLSSCHVIRWMKIPKFEGEE